MAKLGRRTTKLLRETMVLAYVEDSRWGQCHGGRGHDEFPSDDAIVARVLAAAASFADLYPTLSKTEEAHTADDERRRRSMELLAVLVNQARGE